MPGFLRRRARRTDRLAEQQRWIAFVVGGEAGARLLRLLAMDASGDTLLRMIRAAPEPEVSTPRVLGIDDWAKRKGQDYGTILVDLESHCPVDLLPDATSAGVATWLREHPGVAIVSRDRGPEFIKGIQDGAPDAIPVADRWHLLKNLRDGLTRWLETRRACLKAAGEAVVQASPMATDSSVADVGAAKPEEEAPPPMTRAEMDKQVRRARRQERYAEVHRLRAEGLSKSEIARRIPMDRRTVSRYLLAESCPQYTLSRPRRSKLDPYQTYVEQRWREGCRNIAQLLRELRSMGFEGSTSPVRRAVARIRRASPDEAATLPAPPRSPWTARRASWLFVKAAEELSSEEQAALERMRQIDGKADAAYDLSQRFTTMVRCRDAAALARWLCDASMSGIDALNCFAEGIRRDLRAVTNALRLPWSNGQVEGQINRLKLIKRQMYGRAGFDLLRKRVLPMPMTG
jgi:transposase